MAEISPQALAGRGIRLVLADLDNTLALYRAEEPTPQAAAWARALEEQGIQLFLLSNSRKPGRAQRLAEKLGAPFQGHSGKPGRAGYLRAMERMGCRPEETVMVGDQIFTDTLGACWWNPSGLRVTRGAICAMRWRPLSACWGNGGPLYECDIRSRREFRQLFPNPQILAGCAPLDCRPRSGLL